MSAYRGRTGPNFSEFLSNLNSLTPFEENAFNTDQSLDDNDLAMFTNTDFTSLDLALQEDPGFNYSLNNDNGDIKYQDLLGADAHTFTSGPLHNSPADTPQFYPNYNTAVQPGPSLFQADTPSTSARTPQVAPSFQKVDSPAETSKATPEDNSRVAAEEDKRRRNTAASARFRVKKKQREQALERSVKEINDHNSKLQARLDQLEMENKWLKDLITEKNATQSKEEIDEAFEQFKRESEERQDVKAEGSRVKGVGTQ
jgi:hypothetical protein